jgi:hypothetical protein
MNGATRDSVVSSTGSCTLRRAAARAAATTSPATIPPPAATTNSHVTSSTVTEAVMAMIDVRRATSAVASLSRLSPSRMETMRLGIPTRRAIVVAATASGGDTTAPRAKAAAMLTPGTIHQATRPTPTVVKATAPTARMPMACRLARTSTSEVRSAAA